MVGALLGLTCKQCLGLRLPSHILLQRCALASRKLVTARALNPKLGTSVSVYGDVAEGKGEVVRVDFSIDGGGVASKYQTSRQNKVTNVLWYESGNLPDGEHTLTMTYLPVDDVDMDFRLDRIEYTSSPPASHSPPPVDAPQAISTRTSVSVVVQTSTSSQVEVVSGTAVAGGSAIAGDRSLGSGSTQSSTSAQQTSSNDLLDREGNQTVTQTQYLPTAGATDVPSTGDRTDNAGPSTESTAVAASRSVPVGAIVGGVLGALLLLCLLVLAFIVVRRRRRRSTSYALAGEKGAPSSKCFSEEKIRCFSQAWYCADESQTSISPFHSSAAVSQVPAAQASKTARLVPNVTHHAPSESDLTSDIRNATSEAGLTMVTEAAPSYVSGLGPRLRDDFTSEDGTARTWPSGAAEGSKERYSLPPAYR